MLQIASSGRWLMFNRKSVRGIPRMLPWGKPPLTGFFCEDFPSRTTQSCLLLKKAKYLTRNFISLWKRPACWTLSKARDISGATAQLFPDNSIKYNCQKICSWLRSPETILEIRQIATFLGDQQAYYLQVFQILC